MTRLPPNSNRMTQTLNVIQINTRMIGSHKWQIDSVCANDLATGVGTKHAVSRPRPMLGLETKFQTLAIRSRDRDRDLDKMNSSALDSRDHGLEITTLPESNHFFSDPCATFLPNFVKTGQVVFE